MPMEDKKKEPMIDVGEEEGAEITLDNNEQTKAVAEEKIEVQQEEEKPSIEVKEEKVEQKSIDKKVENKKDDLEEYSESVKKRIAKLTHKIREAERQKEEAIRFAQTVKQEADSKYSKLDKTYVSEFERRVKTNLEAVRTALKNAIESGNVDAQIVAQEQLASLNIDAARLGALKAREQNAVKQDVKRDINITPQQTETPSVDPKAEDWASRNSWFGSDSAMTYTAFDLHKRLVNDEGFDPKSDEYYAEIDKRIRLEFPHKFGTKEDTSTESTNKPVQNVASAKRPSQTGRKKTVRLTPSQVAIAKRLGVPLEEYAKHLTTKEV
jgi:hypothetical protein